MRPVATDVARSMICVSVCVLGTLVSCAKTAEPFDMPFGGLSYMNERKHVLLDGDQDRTNPFAATRGDKMAMRPFAKLLWTFVKYVQRKVWYVYMT